MVEPCHAWRAPGARGRAFSAMLALLVGLAGCESREPGSENAGAPTPDAATGETAEDTATIEASLDSIRTALEEAFAARDVDAMASLYARDAIFSPRDGPPVHGRDSIRAYFDRNVPPGVTANIEATDLRALTAEWAYAYGNIRLSFTPEGADAPVQLPATFLVMLRNTREGWKIYRESLSADEPVPGGASRSRS